MTATCTQRRDKTLMFRQETTLELRLSRPERIEALELELKCHAKLAKGPATTSGVVFQQSLGMKDFRSTQPLGTFEVTLVLPSYVPVSSPLDSAKDACVVSWMLTATAPELGGYKQTIYPEVG